jgi:hypothetical protein
MLADIEMTILAVFLFLAFAFGGVEMVTLTFTEYAVQDEAQAIATSEGHFGGCSTDEASQVNTYIDNFCQNQNLDVSGASVSDNISDGQPADYGTNITVTLKVPYNVDVLGGAIPVTLSGDGRSVSSYIPGMTDPVDYTAP